MTQSFTPLQPWTRHPLSPRLLQSALESDLFTSTGDGLQGSPLNNGTVSTTSVDADINHAGVLVFRDSTTAFGGYSFGSNSTPMVLGGGETFESIVKWEDVRPTSFGVSGFRSSTTAGEPASGAYCLMTGNATGALLQAVTSVGGVRTYGTSTYQMALNVWYRLHVEVSIDRSKVICSLYGSPHGEGTPPLWTQEVNTNIPSLSDRLGFGVYGFNTNTDASSDIMAVDWVGYSCSRQMNR